MFDRDDLSAAPRTVETGQFSYDDAYGIVGSTLLSVGRAPGGNDGYRGQPLWSVTTKVEEADIAEVLAPAGYGIRQAPDGSVLVAGAEKTLWRGDLDWGVYRIAEAADGSVKRQRVAAVDPMPAQIHGVTAGSGIVSVATNSDRFSPSDALGAYRSTWLSTPAAGGTPRIVKTTVDGTVSGRDGWCGGGTQHCIRMFADGTGHHGRAAGTEGGLTMLYTADGADKWGPTLDSGDDNPQLTDLSGRFAVVDGASSGRQVIGEFRPGAQGRVVQRRDRVAAAVWGDTLWSGALSGDVVTATRLPAGSVVESFTTRNGCTPSDLQAVGQWVYWLCAEELGEEQTGGVYDRVSKRTVTVPKIQALLGDGFLAVGGPASFVNADLTVFDLHGGLPAAGRSLEDLPHRVVVTKAQFGATGGQFAGPRSSWAVDRFGGGIVYADDQQQVHVVPTGVPTSALSVIDTMVDSTVANWSGEWWLSKPAASWRIDFRELSGAMIRTVSGSDARGLIRARWDGKDAAGVPVKDGAFTWTLTAEPADGRGAALSLASAPATPLGATTAPSITGAVTVGSTVKAAAGAWIPAPATYAYQWAADGTAVKGATSASLPISAAVVGKRLTVTVTASLPGHPSGTATSAASKAVAKGKAPVAKKKPAITGTAKIGKTMQASTGTWSLKVDSYRYEWRFSGVLIRGATGKSLKLTSTMRDKKVTVTVIARKAGYLDGKAASKAVVVRR